MIDHTLIACEVFTSLQILSGHSEEPREKQVPHRGKWDNGPNRPEM